MEEWSRKLETRNSTWLKLFPYGEQYYTFGPGPQWSTSEGTIPVLWTIWPRDSSTTQVRSSRQTARHVDLEISSCKGSIDLCTTLGPMEAIDRMPEWDVGCWNAPTI